MKKQYDLIGKDYISTRKEQGSIKEQESREFILKNVDFKNKVVLDLGCGHGEDIVHFENKGAKEVYGIDSSKLMVNEAKRLVKNPQRVIMGDISKLPFSENQFDIIVAKHSLHYLPDFNLAFEEIAKKLKKGGIFIFTVPHPFSEIFLKESKDYNKKETIYLMRIKNLF